MKRSMKRMIAKLIEWLTKRGLSDADILDCIRYITK